MWNKTEYKISQHFACALEYGDYGDMTEEEISQFDAWVEYAQDGIAGHWSIEDHDGEDFGCCEVSGLFANRATVRYNFKTEG